MTLRLNKGFKTAVAVSLFVAALSVAVLRAGTLSHIGNLRLGAPLAMNDFYSSVYYPVLAFANGENPHDRERLKASYPEVEEYPPYLPLNLVLYSPFGALTPRTAAIAFFMMNAVLALVLSGLALRLAGLSPKAWRVALVAGLLLVSRPGHWALISGQHAFVLTVLSYLALLHARRSPMLSGLALGVCMYKLTYGVPLAALMAAAGYLPAVGMGLGLAAALNVPLLLVLAEREGGLVPFLTKLIEGYQTWEHLPGMDPGTSLDPMSFNRTDVATFVSRILGYAIPDALGLALSLTVMTLAAIGLLRLARRRGGEAEHLVLALLCLGTLVAIYHMTYDLVLLTAPVVALAARGLPPPGTRSLTLAFGLLFAVPSLNWLLTASALQAWQPPHAIWILVASVNTACLLALFGGYLGLSFAHTGTPPSLPRTKAAAPASD